MLEPLLIYLLFVHSVKNFFPAECFAYNSLENDCVKNSSGAKITLNSFNEECTKYLLKSKALLSDFCEKKIILLFRAFDSRDNFLFLLNLKKFSDEYFAITPMKTTYIKAEGHLSNGNVIFKEILRFKNNESELHKATFHFSKHEFPEQSRLQHNKNINIKIHYFDKINNKNW